MKLLPAPVYHREKRFWMWAAFAIPLLLALGALAAERPRYGVIVAVLILIVGLSSITPAAVPILAMPALVVIERVGSGAVELSISDMMLFAAFWPALFLSPKPFSRPIRQILWLSATYQLATLFTVITNRYTANTVEWFHAWLLVSGALIVGWAVGRSGYASTGLRLLVLACVIIALLTCLQFAANASHGDFGPVFLNVPWGMHKNFIGCVLAFGAVISYARPLWLRWSPMFSYSCFALLCAGVLASQARQALISLGVAIVVLVLRKDPDRRRSRWILLAFVPAMLLVASVVQAQLQEDNQFNSSYQRLTWYEQSLQVFHQLPWFGAGLRWWYTDRFPFAFQPPNAELEVLTSAGIIGLIGFLVLFGGILIVLWRINPRYGTLAFAVVLTRLVQGQFDLFWIAAQVPIPLAVAGVCLGAMERDKIRRIRRIARENAAGSRELAIREKTGRHRARTVGRPYADSSMQ